MKISWKNPFTFTQYNAKIQNGRQNCRRFSGMGQEDSFDMVKIGKKEKSDQLYKECMNFFDDLCTVTELQSMEQRYQVAVLLDKGLIYNDILERTGASSATISRVNRSLSYGTGAYAKLFERIKPKKK